MRTLYNIVRGFFVVVAVSLPASCTPKATPQPEGVDSTTTVKPVEAPGEMRLMSGAFVHEGKIPKKYTCEGEDISPALSWTRVPEGAKSLVLIVDDPDAPDPAAPKMTWVHWVLYNLPPTGTGLEEGVKTLPPGAKAAMTNFDKTEYGGPCPPIGRHRYFHKLYALDITLPDLPEPTKETVLAAMKDHILAQTELIGTYEKGQE